MAIKNNTTKQYTSSIILALMFLTLSLASCSLDESPRDQIEEEEAYTSSETLLQHTVGTLYSYIGGHSDGQGLQGTCRGVYDLQTFGSDEALLPTRGVDWYDGGIWQALYCHTWSPGHEVIENSWMYLYKMIAMCNRSLAILESHSDMLVRIQKERYTAEVRTLRAIYYWYLLDLFGRVPIVTSTDVSMNDVTLSERSVVFDFVRSELESQIPYLANRNSVEEGEYYGRVTQAVGCFVLAKLYLNAEVYTDNLWTDAIRPSGSDMRFNIHGNEMNAWEACIYYCDMLKQMGYRLESYYSTNFKVNNEISKENIWIIPMDQYLYNNLQQNMFRSYHFRHADAMGFGGENGTSASLTALEANNFGQSNQDNRFDLNYWGGLVTDAHGSIVYDRSGNQLEYKPLEVAMDVSSSPYKETAGARMKKYEIDTDAFKSGVLMDNDIVLFRYGDVLLMQSEAKIRNQQSGQAELDLIRNRVGMPTIPATLDNIYTERLVELAWEGWRRNDMIRFDRYKSTYTGSNAVDESDHHTIVYPIPGVVVTLNHNIQQNPGY